MKFRRKVTVDAAKWTGENLDEIHALIGDTDDIEVARIGTGHLIVKVQPEWVTVNVGDYLVLKEECGDEEDVIKVEVFTVRGAVFEASYEAVA